MSVPAHLWRYPTREAIDSLARRFGLPNEPNMQDWPWEVADLARIDEFIDAYENGNLSDDEKFVLMEMLIQSFDDVEEPLEGNSKWRKVLGFIEANISLHIYSVWYWSQFQYYDLPGPVVPSICEILEKYKDRFLQPDD